MLFIDAIVDLLTDATVYDFTFSGTLFDCGSKLGDLQATIAFGSAQEKSVPNFANSCKTSWTSRQAPASTFPYRAYFLAVPWCVFSIKGQRS